MDHRPPLAAARNLAARCLALCIASSGLLLGGCWERVDDDDEPLKTDAALTQAVSDVHAALQRDLGKDVPSLSALIQTPDAAYFASVRGEGGTEVTPDTYFRFASNTKNFTAAAVMKMHQDGWLRYTDRITARIPGTELPYVPDTPAWALPYKARITIRELLQHSAGVFDAGNDPVSGCTDTYEDCVLRDDPTHTFTPEELVSQVATRGLSYFEPGQGYHYSNTGYSTLAEIVGRVYSAHTGRTKTWGDYVHDHLVGPDTPRPLDLHFPERGNDRRLPTPRACGRILQADADPIVTCNANVSAKIAEGNGIGTMRELNRWVRSLHSGRNVLKPAIVGLMHDDVSSANPTYALGTFKVQNLGYGHNGATLGNLSEMLYDPETGVSVVVYLPLWDLTEGATSFLKVFNALNCTGWIAREALGYSGRPATATCPSP